MGGAEAFDTALAPRQPEHPGLYVNETTFRLNEGNCEVDTLDRMESLVRQMPGARLAWRDLIADNGDPAVPLAVKNPNP